MKAEQQIFLSLSEFEGLKLATSLSLALLRNEFAADLCNTLQDKRKIRNVERLRTRLARAGVNLAPAFGARGGSGASVTLRNGTTPKPQSGSLDRMPPRGDCGNTHLPSPPFMSRKIGDGDLKPRRRRSKRDGLGRNGVGFRHNSPLTSGVPDYGNYELGLIAEIKRALHRWLLAHGIVPEQVSWNPLCE